MKLSEFKAEVKSIYDHLQLVESFSPSDHVHCAWLRLMNTKHGDQATELSIAICKLEVLCKRWLL